MKVWFHIALFALGLTLLVPANAPAFEYTSSGYGWLASKAVRHSGGIHYHGPLYNYGPYYGGAGYLDMTVSPPFHGTYRPAYPYSSYGAGYGYGSGYGSGGNYGYAPASSVPTTSGPISAPATSGPGCTNCLKNAADSNPNPAIAPTGYQSMYPAYLSQPWVPVR